MPLPDQVTVHVAGPGDNHPCCGKRPMTGNDTTRQWRDRAGPLRSVLETECQDCKPVIKEHERIYLRALGLKLGLD